MASMAASAQLLPTITIAQQAASGTLSGRVMNATNGMYLSNARVSVEGTSLETFTNELGEYTLRNVPAGTATIRVVFTGQEPISAQVTVAEGDTQTKNFAFGAADGAFDPDSGTLTLDPFVVETQRYRTAQEIAVNEERSAVNIKNVVATDSLGHVPGGNIGEFVQFLPGVDISYGGTYTNENDASSISVRGFGAEDTAILVDGMPMSSPSPASLSRTVNLDMISINNATRIEITKVNTPDMPSDSPGGSVNLISRSAFEFAKPSYNLELSATINSMETSIFKKEPGPANKKTYHTLPSGTFSASVPVNANLGFAVSLSSFNRYSTGESFAARWKTANQTINLTPIGGVNNHQISNANGRVNYDNPHLERVQITDQPWNNFSQSGSFRVDWRPIKDLTVRANVQYSTYTGINVSRRAEFRINAAEDWSSDFVRGYQYQLSPTFNPGHNSSMTIDSRDKEGDTLQAYVKLQYRRGPWTVDANASRAISNGKYTDEANEHFSGLDLSMQTGRIDYLDIREGVPGQILTWDRAGNALDASKLENWVLGSTLNAKSGEAFQKDIQDKFSFHVRRDLDFFSFPLSVKVGVDRQTKDARKWGRGTGFQMRYTGPQLTSSDLLDEYRTDPIYGLRAPQQWASTYKLYDIYKANPELFDQDYEVGMTIGNYNSRTTQTKSLKETADAYFGMLEGKFFDNRLSVITGVRQKRAKVVGYQPYVDSKFNYVRLPNGMVYTDDVYINGVKYDGSTGPIAGGGTYARDAVITDTALRARMVAAGAIVPDALALGPGGVNGNQNNNFQLAQERLRTRTIDQKRKEPEVPQVQLSYSITDDLTAKLAWSRETKLPNIENGTRGGILTGGNSLNINENLNPDGSLGSGGTITMSNPGLLPEIVNSWNGELAYYTKSGGRVAVSYFYKDIKDLHEEVQVFADSPEYATILQSFGLSPADYANWTLSSTVNSAGTAKAKGIEVDIRQNLGIFGSWARGLDMFLTYSHRSNPASSEPTTPTEGWIAKLPSRDKYTGGLSFSMRRFSIQARGVFEEGGLTRSSAVNFTPTGGTARRIQMYNIFEDNLRLKLDANFILSPRYSLFASASDVLNSRTSTRTGDVFTGVMPEYAYYTGHKHKGVNVVVGVRATF
jgi:Outer membrane receptor for ferrienterochelin and colicins